MMPKIKVNCSWCGKELFKWTCRIKSNNSPENLKVFKNQSEHLKEHLRSDKKYKR